MPNSYQDPGTIAQIKTTDVPVNSFIFAFFFQSPILGPKNPQHQTHTLTCHLTLP